MLKENTQSIQEALGTYTKDGVLPVLPGVTEGRLHHYRRLVFNIIRESLSTAYPLTKNLLTPKQWEELVKEFFASHDCQSPQVWQMPGELLEYVLEVEHELLTKHKFMKELMEFEWAEVEVYCQKDEDLGEVKSKGDWYADQPVLNPYHQILAFEYPVHRMNAKYITADKKGQYYALLYRDSEGKVQFSDLSALHVFILEGLETEEYSVKDIQLSAGVTFGIEDAKLIREKTEEFLNHQLESGMILGFKAN